MEYVIDGLLLIALVAAFFVVLGGVSLMIERLWMS